MSSAIIPTQYHVSKMNLNRHFAVGHNVTFHLATLATTRDLLTLYMPATVWNV